MTLITTYISRLEAFWSSTRNIKFENYNVQSFLELELKVLPI